MYCNIILDIWDLLAASLLVHSEVLAHHFTLSKQVFLLM